MTDFRNILFFFTGTKKWNKFYKNIYILYHIITF
nr:MAG TPA: hypothetical protein [Caudoviricetes sp.]